MSTPPIPPTSLTGTPPLTGASAGTGTGGATSVPPGILALPNGSFVRGQIVHLESSGLATLRTPKGDMTLRTDLALARGSEVVIRLDTSAQGLKAKIISVDGLSARELESQSANLQRATAPVDDLIDLPTGSTVMNTARNATIPVTRLTSQNQPPLPEVIPDAVIVDIPDSPIPQMVPMRALLLSRSPELPQLLAMLPPSIAVPKERLEAGAMLRVAVVSSQLSAASGQLPVVSEEAPLPLMQAPAASVPPSSANPTQGVPTQPLATTPLSGTPVPAFMTAPDGKLVPNPLLQGLEEMMGQVSVAGTQPSPTSFPSPAMGKDGLLLSTPQPAAGAPLSVPVQGAATAPLPGAAMVPTVVKTADGQYAPNPALQVLEQVVGQAPVSSGQGAVISGQPSVISSQLPVMSEEVPAMPLMQAAPPAVPAGQVAAVPGTVSAANNPAVVGVPLPLTPQLSASLTQGFFPAQVIGMEQSGETVLKTPLGVIKLDLVSHTGQRLQLPHESVIQLQLLSLEAESHAYAVPLKEQMMLPATVAELSQQWEGLEDALTLLQQTHPAIAQQVMQQHIPQPGPKLARDILFFLLALKTDDSEMWIGKKALEAMEQSSRGDIIRKFSSELGTIRQLFTNSPSPDWQAAFIPIHYQGEWQQMRLYVKRDRDGQQGQNANEPASTRFIMEVDLSRMGSLQFDGFVKKQSQNTQFDLIIRSAQALRAEDQHAIRSIYADAAAITGFKGGLNFQIGHPFPVQPLEEMLKSDRTYLA